MDTLTSDGPGIHRDHCERSIREEVSEVAGVDHVAVDLDTKCVSVIASELSDTEHRAAIAEAGYEAT
jgi:copper chaperone CopZ